MPEQFDDGGQGEFLASQMSGAFSEEAARKLCFEQGNQIRVLKQEVEYRKKRDEKLTYVAADITGKLADAEIELGALRARYREAVEALEVLAKARRKTDIATCPCEPEEVCDHTSFDRPLMKADAVLAKAREQESAPKTDHEFVKCPVGADICHHESKFGADYGPCNLPEAAHREGEER